MHLAVPKIFNSLVNQQNTFTIRKIALFTVRVPK